METNVVKELKKDKELLLNSEERKNVIEHLKTENTVQLMEIDREV